MIYISHQYDLSKQIGAITVVYTLLQVNILGIDTNTYYIIISISLFFLLFQLHQLIGYCLLVFFFVFFSLVINGKCVNVIFL